MTASLLASASTQCRNTIFESKIMTDENKKITDNLRQILHSSRHAVFFGGAGVSTDSGIPDFRGSSGLYADNSGNEYYLSRECLLSEPERFYEFFKANMVFPNAAPNPTHKALAKLESAGIIKSVITQNIDGLHQTAGSGRVIELHGTLTRFYCTKCRRSYTKIDLAADSPVPLCSECGGLVRPDVTLYGERLDGFTFADAANEIKKADVLIVGGTSLLVNPAASLLDGFEGEHLIIINHAPTPYDKFAEYVIRDSISEVFAKLL